MDGSPGSLTVALISDVFVDAADHARLSTRLEAAKGMGAELAVLPEIPLDPWSPATRAMRDEDAEPPGGARHQVLAEAARQVGIGLVGGAIVRDPRDGQRRNTALTFDATGRLIDAYAKVHLPEEPGFWETSHYRPGERPPVVIGSFGLPIGVQICSDINRPEGCHLLGALGAEVIVAPRASERDTYDRWRVVFQANALTSATYMLSVNRPSPEHGVPLGGPSIAVAPDGEVILETTETIAVVRLEHAVIAEARLAYPGYLPVRSDIYAAGWSTIASSAEEGAA
jgi:predicted amidohydrolase